MRESGEITSFYKSSQKAHFRRLVTKFSHFNNVRAGFFIGFKIDILKFCEHFKETDPKFSILLKKGAIVCALMGGYNGSKIGDSIYNFYSWC